MWGFQIHIFDHQRPINWCWRRSVTVQTIHQVMGVEPFPLPRWFILYVETSSRTTEPRRSLDDKQKKVRSICGRQVAAGGEEGQGRAAGCGVDDDPRPGQCCLGNEGGGMCVAATPPHGTSQGGPCPVMSSDQ